MNQIQLVLLFSIAFYSCTPSYSVLNREFTGIAGNETSIDWGNTTYKFGTRLYDVIIFESYTSSTTVVEQGDYYIMKNDIYFNPSMKRIFINPDTCSIRGNRISGGWAYLPKYFSDSVSVDIRDTYFKPYNFELCKKKGYLNIYNPQTNRRFTALKRTQY